MAPYTPTAPRSATPQGATSPASPCLSLLLLGELACPDCGCQRSEAEGDEGWNVDAGACFSCVDSVYDLAEKFSLWNEADGLCIDNPDNHDSLDLLREKVWEARESHPDRERILSCLTFAA